MNKLFTNKRDAIKKARALNEEGRPYKRHRVREVVIGSCIFI